MTADHVVVMGDRRVLEALEVLTLLYEEGGEEATARALRDANLRR